MKQPMPQAKNARSRTSARPTRRSADFQSAVSPISNRQGAETSKPLDLSQPAQAGSTATQQTGSLRYGRRSSGPRKKSRDLEKVYPRKDFVAKLRRLADALESEKAFAIQVAGERLHIPADARFNLEHEREGGREELEFQLLWQRPARAARRAKTASGSKPNT